MQEAPIFWDPAPQQTIAWGWTLQSETEAKPPQCALDSQKGLYIWPGLGGSRVTHELLESVAREKESWKCHSKPAGHVTHFRISRENRWAHGRKTIQLHWEVWTFLWQRGLSLVQSWTLLKKNKCAHFCFQMLLKSFTASLLPCWHRKHKSASVFKPVIIYIHRTNAQ